MKYDVVIVGASFAGLTLAHHLPKHLKVLVIDAKKSLDHYIETTGLITQATYDEMKSFVNVDDYIPNKINSIGVIATDYKKHFFSFTKEPWLYTTDTPQLVKRMSETLPKTVELKIQSMFRDHQIVADDEYPVKITYFEKGVQHDIQAKFLVGADGALSSVAKSSKTLSQNKRFLVGMEKVFYGDITFGPHPESAVYHYWFGEFSLGYGGWLSPTIINGKKAFRLGLAKMQKDALGLKKIDDFVKTLEEKEMIKINKKEDCNLTFTSMIPISGPLWNVHDKYSMLLGDAAGFCGAFAADGIKGAVISGKVAAKLIPQHLKGDKSALKRYKKEIQSHNKLMKYYWKQVLYRRVWDLMKSDRSFDTMFDIISRSKDSFLNQFCDSKDRHKSLVWIVLKFKNLPLVFKYAFFIFLDFFKRRKDRD